MHVVIMGCGRTGATLARGLIERGNTVAVIDKDIAAFRRLGSGFAGQAVTGNGFDRGVLLQAGISHADAFAAVAHGDNSNIIATRVARETYGVQQVIARIYDTRRAEVYERLGIPTIATVRWTVHRMLNTLSPTDDREVWRDPTSSVAIVEPMLHVAWVGHSLSEWQRHTGAKAAYVTRFGNAMLPTASTVIADGDRVAALVNDDIAEKVRTASARPPADLHGEGEQ